MAIFHQAENVIMKRSTNIIMYENFVVTNLWNRLLLSGSRIFKTVIFYVASALSSLNEALYHKFYNVLMSIHTFFLWFMHILNTFYLKQKKICLQFFFHILIKFFFGCIIDHKKILKRRVENLFHWKLARNTIFNEHCWCSCPMCVKSRRCSVPRATVYYIYMVITRRWHIENMIKIWL